MVNDDDLEKLSKVRFTHEPDANYPKDALHIIPRVSQQKEWSCSTWFTWWTYTVETNEKMLHNCTYSLKLVPAANNKKQTITEGLAKLLLS